MTARGEKWQYRARCRGLDLNLFVPDGKVGSDARRAHTWAARFCVACPVTRQCLELALTAEGTAPAQNRFGVYGGLSPDQRHGLHRKLIDQQAAA